MSHARHGDEQDQLSRVDIGLRFAAPRRGSVCPYGYHFSKRSHMNYKRIFVSAIVATIVYFVVGGLVFAVMGPGEFSRYPAVFRTAPDMKSHIPVGLIGTFLGILVVTVIFARGCEGKRGVAEGAFFGMLVGV